MHNQEVAHGMRFEFGKNWNHFLNVIDDTRIVEAEESLKQMLEVEELNGKSFLDIGSGSGLSSLAARRLGARVHSFDYDPQSVNCTREMRKRFYSESAQWVIEEGSALNREFVQSLGQFDIVYSWGVLHHTGDMWGALESADIPVREGGKLFIAIYNDQGGWSQRWKLLKRTYNKLPVFLKLPFAVMVMGLREMKFALISLIKFQPWSYVQSWTQYSNDRGMSRWHDLIDWIGGYPFEVAKPEQIFDFYRARGYKLERMKTSGGGVACNEFVFTKINGEGR